MENKMEERDCLNTYISIIISLAAVIFSIVSAVNETSRGWLIAWLILTAGNGFSLGINSFILLCAIKINKS